MSLPFPSQSPQMTLLGLVFRLLGVAYYQKTHTNKKEKKKSNTSTWKQKKHLCEGEEAINKL